MIKVFLGGEGKNEIGTRSDQPMGDIPGVVEVLLRRVRPTGWDVSGARVWKSIRKYRAGAARHADHADVHNVLGLVLEAYEHACEMLVFTRDRDTEPRREQQIQQTLARIDTHIRDFAAEYHYELAVVGGVPLPSLEGWILCLLGHHRTDDMSNTRAAAELVTAHVTLKSTEQYVDIAEAADLPTGQGSLPTWLAQTDATFRRLIDGTTP